MKIRRKLDNPASVLNVSGFPDTKLYPMIRRHASFVEPGERFRRYWLLRCMMSMSTVHF